MKIQLSSLAYGLWFTVMLLLTLLCILVTIRRTFSRLPFFSNHLYLCLLGNVTCYLLAQTASAVTYAYVERLTGLLAYALLGLFLWRDVYMPTFGPRIALPDWVPPRVLLYSVCLYAAVLVTAVALPNRWITPSLAALALVARALLGIVAAASVVLIAYSFHLGITWNSSTLAITVALAFSSIFDLAAGYIRQILTSTGAVILRNASMLAYLVTLVVWLWAVLKEKVKVEVEELTPEMVAELKKEIDATARVADAWILHRESNS